MAKKFKYLDDPLTMRSSEINIYIYEFYIHTEWQIEC